MKPLTIYWAGRLFNQAELLWNRKCAYYLHLMGYKVILPQEEAEKFKLPDGSYDLDQIAQDCVNHCIECDIAIFNLDGPDVDSGTALEAGVKIHQIMMYKKGIALGVRTDFRAHSEDPLTGVNAMFRLLHGLVTCPHNVDTKNLCHLIDERIKQLGGV